MKFLKKIVIFGIFGGTLFFFLSYHIILIESSVKLLKKSTLTLNYTFFNAKGKTAMNILSVDALRDDGIGDILVEEGRLSEEKLELLMEKFKEEGN